MWSCGRRNNWSLFGLSILRSQSFNAAVNGLLVRLAFVFKGCFCHRHHYLRRRRGSYGRHDSHGVSCNPWPNLILNELQLNDWIHEIRLRGVLHWPSWMLALTLTVKMWKKKWGEQVTIIMNRYLQLEELGNGTYGSVLLGQRVDTGEKVSQTQRKLIFVFHELKYSYLCK